MENIRISEITTVDASLVAPINHLLSQLTSASIHFSIENLKTIVEDTSSHLYILYFNDEVAGMLTLGSYVSPTGPKSWVEDVVVDSKFRGHSLGRKLIESVIAEAKKIQGNQLMLTSKPERIVANKLYQAVGFLPKKTNVYLMKFFPETE